MHEVQHLTHSVYLHEVQHLTHSVYLRQSRNIVFANGKTSLMLSITSFCVRKRNDVDLRSNDVCNCVAKRCCVLRTQTQKERHDFHRVFLFGASNRAHIINSKCKSFSASVVAAFGGCRSETQVACLALWRRHSPGFFLLKPLLNLPPAAQGLEPVNAATRLLAW